MEQGGGTRRAAPLRPSVPSLGEQGGVGSFGLRRVVVRRGKVVLSSACREKIVELLAKNTVY